MSISIQNRNNSWRKVQETLSLRMSETYSWIQMHGPVSPQELCDVYDMKFNEVAPRFTKLYDAGYIKQHGSIHNNRSNKKNTTYIATPVEDIPSVRRSIRDRFRAERDAIIDDVALNALVLSCESVEWLNKRINQLELKIKKLQDEDSKL